MEEGKRERKRGRPRKVKPVQEEVKGRGRPRVVKDAESEFSAIQGKALLELRRRVEDIQRLQGMGVDELGAILKTCRENLVVIRSLSMGDGTGDMKMEVVSRMDLEEESGPAQDD